MDKIFNTAESTTCVGVPTLAGLNSKTPCAFTTSIARPDGVSLEDYIAAMPTLFASHFIINSAVAFKVKNLLTGEEKTLEAGYHDLVGYKLVSQKIEMITSNGAYVNTYFDLIGAELPEGIKFKLYNIRFVNVNGINLTSTEGMFSSPNLGSYMTELDLSQLLLPTSLESSASMFEGCKYIKIILPSKILSKNTSLMFKDNLNLSEIDLEPLHLDETTTTQGMFENTPKLLSIAFKGNPPYMCRNFSYMFHNCGAKELDINPWGDSLGKANDTRGMFMGMSNITKIDIYMWKLPSLLYASSMFEGINNVESINIISMNITSIVLFDNIFLNCKKLNSVCLPSAGPKSATSAQYAFSGTAIEKLDLSKWVLTKLINVKGMFTNNLKLWYLNISNINFANTTIATDFISECPDLVVLLFGNTLKTSINLTGCTKLSYVSAKNVLNACADLTGQTKQTITFDSNVILKQSDIDAMTAKNWAVEGAFISSESNLHMLVNSETTVTKIADNTTEQVSESSGEINRTDCYLTDIGNTPTAVPSDYLNLVISGISDGTAESKENTLLGFAPLPDSTTITTASTVSAKVVSGKLSLTDLTGWLLNKALISSLDLRGLQGKVTCFKNAFSGMSSLKKLDLSMLDFSECTDYTGAFTGCASLTNLRLGTGIKKSLDLSACKLTNNTTVESLLQSLANADDGTTQTLRLFKASTTNGLSVGEISSTAKQHGFPNLNWIIIENMGLSGDGGKSDGGEAQ